MAPLRLCLKQTAFKVPGSVGQSSGVRERQSGQVMSQVALLDRLFGVSVRVRQVVLAVLALSAADVGVWAELDPSDWYRSFPGLGMHWLSVLGPYNEHLSRDVGGLYLALLVLSVGAMFRAKDTYLVRLTGGAWAAFAIPHLIYHSAHLDMYGIRDQVLNVVTLGGTVLLAGSLVFARSVDGNVEASRLSSSEAEPTI